MLKTKIARLNELKGLLPELKEQVKTAKDQDAKIYLECLEMDLQGAEGEVKEFELEEIAEYPNAEEDYEIEVRDFNAYMDSAEDQLEELKSVL